jgi:hypothetical protein
LWAAWCGLPAPKLARQAADFQKMIEKQGGIHLIIKSF